MQQADICAVSTALARRRLIPQARPPACSSGPHAPPSLSPRPFLAISQQVRLCAVAYRPDKGQQRIDEQAQPMAEWRHIALDEFRPRARAPDNLLGFDLV